MRDAAETVKSQYIKVHTDWWWGGGCKNVKALL
jgi:hypothetical protein